MTADMLVNTSPVGRRMWQAVAASDEVTDAAPMQVWLCGHPWVLARLDGRLVAFADRCPHRLAPLSAGRVVRDEGADVGGGGDGNGRAAAQVLACGYHGWRFDAGGRCVLVPATGRREGISRRARLAAPAGLAERYGLVWLAIDEPWSPLPEFGEWDAPGFDRARATIVRTTAGAAQLVDNFLDAAHFPFVHTATFGGSADDPVGGGDVHRDGHRVTSVFATTYRDGSLRDQHDSPAAPGGGRDAPTGPGPPDNHTVRKTVGPAYNVHLRLDFPDTRVAVGILLACQPETDGSTRVYKLLARNDLAGDPARTAAFVAWQDTITFEDLAILERYPSQALPLDLRAEGHTRVDRLSVAWRRLMAEWVAAG